MNVRDSEALIGRFVAGGWKLAENYSDADLILINTCAVRQHAQDRAVGFTRSLSSLAKNGKKPVIAFLGCVAKADAGRLKKIFTHVDIIAGPAELDKVYALVQSKAKSVVAIEDRARDEKFYSTDYTLKPGFAQVVISTGCNNWCSYCIVPRVRGELICRRPEDIISEVKANAAKGCGKITLLGQNVNDYLYKAKGKKADFVDLLKMAAAVPGVKEIDFTSSHPRNQSIELFKAMRDLPTVRKHLHMAMQSGSSRILKAMNRGYTKSKLLGIIKRYRDIIGGTIGTDVIVGYPGETDKDFKDTVDVIKKAVFDYAYIFMYSPRPGTAAANLADDVPLVEKKRRHAELLGLQRKLAKNK